MAAPRPKKKAPVKKKPPAKKKPSFLRKDTSRPARDAGKGGMRQATMDSLKQGPSQPQGPEAPRYPEKIGPKKPDTKRSLLRLKGGTLYVRKDAASVIMKKAASKIPVVGAAVGFITDAAPAGEGSTKDKYTTLKKKYSSAIGPTKPKASTGSRKPAPGTNYSGQEKKKPMKPAPGSNYSGKSSTYSGYGNFNPPKTSAANTAATSTASTSSGGGSQAAAVAKAGGSATNVSKAKVGKQTKYQRNETAMEQKRSSNRPKKSIFSLFRKG